MVVDEFTTEAEVHNSQEGIRQPEDDKQLHSVPAKAAGKKDADQILELEGKSISQRVAVSSCVAEVSESIKALRADIAEGHIIEGSLVQAQREAIKDLKVHAMEAAKALAGTAMQIKEAVAVFMEKRATDIFHEDAQYRAEKTDRERAKITAQIRKMHIQIDAIEAEINEAKKKRGREEDSARMTPATAGTSSALAGGDFNNAKILQPSTLKYSGVSLYSMDKHMSKVETWLNLAYDDREIPDKAYIRAFASTLDDEFNTHLSDDNFKSIKTKKEFQDKLSNVMHKKIPTHSRRINALHQNMNNTECASIFAKRILLHYIQADITQMDYRNLLGHHLLHKLPDTEHYKDIKK